MTPYKPEPQVSQPNPANPDVEVEDMLIMNFADLYDARSKSTDRTWADKLIAEQKSALLAWRDQAVAQARRELEDELGLPVAYNLRMLGNTTWIARWEPAVKTLGLPNWVQTKSRTSPLNAVRRLRAKLVKAGVIAALSATDDGGKQNDR